MSCKTAMSSNSFTINPPHLFVTCAEGLETLLKEELKSLGLVDLRLGFRGIYAPYSWENIFKINYLSRLATRVLLPLAQFACPDPQALYYEAKKIPWDQYLDETKTFAIDANIRHPQIRHSLYGAQVLKDAICDVIREKQGARPSVNIQDPDVQLHVFIQNNRATISYDTSGTPLYKRGWKINSGDAGIPETLAAAILKYANYSENEVLCDPFCGAGTFLIEAAMLSTKTPSGFFRQKWGFLNLPHFDSQRWNAFKTEWDQKRKEPGSRNILGSDSHAKSLELCREHVRITGFEKVIKLMHAPVSTLTPAKSPTLVITNPPFGKRMDAPLQVYRDLGDFLKSKCLLAPWGYVLTSSHHFAKATGCTIMSERTILHGGLKVGLYQLTHSRESK